MKFEKNNTVILYLYSAKVQYYVNHFYLYVKTKWTISATEVSAV